ncbi:hypothetical protein M5R23_02670 [Citrobacter freundii]|uniref:hypothetical protein n=1 Tax=Citrobacter TaxID=544 RepID=UPI002032459E|nr:MULTISPECIES: hypothetical protein [Citrobacter]HEC9577247.1 hypothetical protein [Salmonella enterica subsp. enterica serovar Stanley]MCO8025179.1 hypothetical protein [Citrobacter freundii]MCO8031676.1 hypothetical protein [Citrobacter freundii]MCO8037383.1 hypothetical protein [Citrobacter freundii]MCS0560479.1 hypothetical protein [Citrobacter freundii]
MEIIKKHWGKISLSLLIILMPIIFYLCKFHSLPFSDKTQDWSNFGSYLGGVYSSAFGLASTLILCLTLYYTIKNNSEQSKINTIQLEQLKNESIKNTFTSHIQALNEKLDKRVNKIHTLSNYLSSPSIYSEDKYLEELCNEYNNKFSLARNNIPTGSPSPFEVAFDVLTKFRIRYPQEITALLNILSIVNTCQDNSLKEELIRLFHSLTYRDRTYWIVIYSFFVNDEAKSTLERNPSLIAMADGMSI